MSKIILPIREHAASEYNQAMHGYAKPWHFVVFFLAIIVAGTLVHLALEGTPLYHLLTSGSDLGASYER